MKKTFCCGINYIPEEQEEELQSYEEYLSETNNMFISEINDILGRIKGSSLKYDDKQNLLKIISTHVINQL